MLLAAACSTPLKKLSKEEMKNSPSISDFFNNNIKNDDDVEYNAFDYTKMIQPYSYAKDFCAKDNGILTMEISKGRIDLIIPTYIRDSDSFYKTIMDGNSLINASFGVFSCVANKNTIWGIDISEHGERRSSNNDISKKTYVSWRILSPKELLEIKETEKARISKRDKEISERVKEDNRREKEIILKKTEYIASFRKHSMVGTETNCGPILEIKGDLAKVYYPVKNYGNEHWIRKENLFPNTYPCRFNQGTYIPPEL